MFCLLSLLERVCWLHLTDSHLIGRSIGTCPYLLPSPFLPLSSPSLLSSLCSSLSSEDGTKRKCQLCSIGLHPPRHMPTHTNTHRRGRNPCFPAQTLLDHHHHSEEKTWEREGLESRGRKIRSAPIHLLIPPLVFSLILGFFPLQWF